MADDSFEEGAARRSTSRLARELEGLAPFVNQVRKAVGGLDDDVKTRARQQAAREGRVTTDPFANTIRDVAKTLGGRGGAVGDAPLATAVRDVQSAVKGFVADEMQQAVRSLPRRPTGAGVAPDLLATARQVQGLAPPVPTAADRVAQAASTIGRGQPGILSSRIAQVQGAEVARAAEELARARAAPTRPRESLQDTIARVEGAAPGFGGESKLPEVSSAAAETQARFDALRASGNNLESELARLTRTQALAGDQMHRHGLLTTEFLGAAGRGQVGIRELGIQLGGTIAKFGGWTAAASLTYGALRAIQGLGTGAIESLNGVNQLSRVVTTGFDTTKAQGQFRALSNEFNLPIGTVTAAAYESAKAFKDQNDVMLATKAALYGVKVGELDAATAGQATIAVTRGFKLEAKDLGDVINSVNALQNKFGGNFGQILQGVGAAAGSFGAAGGNYKQLAALISTGSAVTGRSGVEIATGLRRTAELASRPERRQKIIDVLGIDPKDHSITELIERAQTLAARQPKRTAEFARALTTPELASRSIIPILRSQEAYQQRLATALNPGNSAARELATVLRGPREELSKIGNNIQQIGAALAEIGAAQGFGVILRGANLALDATEHLVAALKLIPAPLREAAFAAAPLLLATSALRRFDTGGAILATRFGQTGVGGAIGRNFARNPDRLLRAQVSSGLEDEIKFTTAERERVARETARARSLSIISQNQALRPGLSDAERVRYQEASLAYDQRAVTAEAEYVALQERSLALERQRTAFRQSTNVLGGRVTAAEAAQRQGLIYGSPLDSRPTSSQPFVVAGGREGMVTGAAAGAAESGLIVPAAIAEERAAQQAAQQAGRIAAAGRTARSLAGGLASAIGPFGGVLLGGFALLEYAKFVGDRSSKIKAQLEALRAQATTVQDPQDLIKRSQDELNKHDGFFDHVTDYVSDRFNDPLHGGRNEERARAQREAQARSNLALGQAIPRLNIQGQGFTFKQIQERFRENLRGAAGDPNEIAKARDQAIREVLSSRITFLPGKHPAIKLEVEKVKAQAADFQVVAGSLAIGLSEINNIAGVAGAAGVLASRVGLYGLHGNDVKTASRLVAVAYRQLKTATNAKDFADALAALQSLDGVILDAAKTRLDLALGAAQTPGQAGKARGSYLEQVRRQLVGGVNEEISSVQRGLDQGGQDPRSREANEKYLRQLRRLRATRQDTLSGIEQSTGQDQAGTELESFDSRTQRLVSEQTTKEGKARVAAQRAASRVRIIKANFAKGLATQSDLDQAIAAQNDAAQATADSVDDGLSLLQARQGLSSSRLALSGASQGTLLRKAASDAQAYANAVRSAKGSGSVDYINALKSVADAQKAVQDYVESQAKELVSARSEYAQSRTEDPVRQAAIKAKEARDLLRFAKTPAERLSALATINNTQRDARNQTQSRKAEAIQDDLDFEKIDGQTAIARYTSLLRAMHGNRDLKRDLRRRIFQLKKDLEQSDTLDLNVGDIRVPTVYDVKRLGRSGVNANITNRNTIAVTVTRDADLDKFGEVMEQYTGAGSVRADLRSSQLA